MIDWWTLISKMNQRSLPPLTSHGWWDCCWGDLQQQNQTMAVVIGYFWYRRDISISARSRGICIPDDVLYYLAVWLNITALSLVLEKRKSTQQKKIITIIRSWMFLDKSMIDINQIKSDQTSGNSHRICWYWNAKKRYEEASLQYLEQSVREFCLYCSLWQDVEVRRVLTMIVTCLEVALTKKSSKCRYDQEWPRSHIV